MNRIHPNRFYLEDYRKKKHAYARDGFFGSLRRVRTWSPLIHLILRATGLAQRGLANALDLKLKQVTLDVSGLPAGFSNCRILFIADLHIEGLDALADKVIEMIKNLQYDYCFLGGDYSLYDRFDIVKTKQQMQKIIEHIKTDKIYGVLGNHDYYETAVFLQSLGVKMLINENVAIERDEAAIYLAGVDDCYVFDCADIAQASAGIPASSFKILLSHCPQLYRQAQKHGFNLFFAGHTHGGQICLPGSIPLIKCAKIPRRLIKGLWKYKNMTGFTTAGAGASGNVIARFNCPPEIAVLTLKAGISPPS
jgi:predicted MPP superfamily phosphohydrolase